MAENTFYSEQQRFSQRWLKAILYFVLIITLAVPVITFARDSLNIISFVPLTIVCAIILLFKKMELTLFIDENKIEYKFYPFHLRKNIVNKEDVKSMAIVRYDPISEYGGWGIRFGRNGKAYTVTGNYGLRVTFKPNKTILIGTASPKQLLSYLKKFNYSPVTSGMELEERESPLSTD